MIRVPLARLELATDDNWPSLRSTLLRWHVCGKAHVELERIPLDVVTVALTPSGPDLAHADLVVHDPSLEAQMRARLGDRPPSTG